LPLPIQRMREPNAVVQTLDSESDAG
jgi:hypothetical protein